MFSLILPFHSDFQTVINTLEYNAARLEEQCIKEVLLCHNGPNLEAHNQLILKVSDKIKLLHTDSKGLGAGYRLGILNSTQPYSVLSASDLPFGFSDIERFLEFKVKGKPYPPIAIGSKAHPASDVSAYPIKRRLYSLIFYIARCVILGFKTPKDSQGTIICNTELGRRLLTSVISDDYFFSLEFLTLASSSGNELTELPVRLINHGQQSSVSPTSDGISMLMRLFELRQRAHEVNLG